MTAEKPDFYAVASKLVERLDLLLAGSSSIGEELADLVQRVRVAIRDDDTVAQSALVPEIQGWMEKDREQREDVGNAFQLFFYYVHLRNGWDVEGMDGNWWWVQVGA